MIGAQMARLQAAAISTRHRCLCKARIALALNCSLAEPSRDHPTTTFLHSADRRLGEAQSSSGVTGRPAIAEITHDLSKSRFANSFDFFPGQPAELAEHGDIAGIDRLHVSGLARCSSRCRSSGCPQTEPDRVDDYMTAHPTKPARKPPRIVPAESHLSTAQIVQQLEIRLLDHVIQPLPSRPRSTKYAARSASDVPL